MIYKLLVISLVFSFHSLMAQESIEILGKIIEKGSSDSIPNATVTLLDLNGKTLNKSLSRQNGSFSIRLLTPDSVQIMIEHINYEDKILKFKPLSTSFDLGQLVMFRKVRVLNEVLVETNVPAISIKSDTIEFKADSFPTRKNGDVEQLLKKLPGLLVLKDGTIVANGKRVSRLTINGKDFFDIDNQSLTRSIPAAIVDKIQVIDDYGEDSKYSSNRTSSPEKVINIKLKKNISTGYFSRFDLGYSFENRYKVGASINSFNSARQFSAFAAINNVNTGTIEQNYNFSGSLGKLINVTNSAIEGLGGKSAVSTLIKNQDLGFITAVPSYSIGNTTLKSIGMRFAEYDLNKFKFYSSAIAFSVDNRSNLVRLGNEYYSNNYLSVDSKNESHINNSGFRVYNKFEFIPDSTFSVRISPTYRVNSKKDSNYLDESKEISNTFLSSSLTDEVNKVSSNEISVESLFRKIFTSSKAKIYLNSIYSRYKRRSDDNSKYYYTSYYLDSLNQISRTHETGFIFSNSLIADIPFTRRISLETTYRFDYSNSNVDRNTYSFIDSNFVKNIQSSGLFAYSNYYYSIRGNLKYSERKLSATLGIQLDWYNYRRMVELKSSFDRLVNISPNVLVNYNRSKTNSYQFLYSANILPPSSFYLNPIKDSSNASLIYQGNINLKPEISHTLMISTNQINFISGKFFVAYLSAKKTFNKIIESIELLTNGKSQITYQNTDYNSQVSLYYNFSKPFKNKLYEITISGNILFERYSFASQGLFKVNTSNINQALSFGINKDWIEYSTGAAITSTTLFMNGSFERCYNFSVYTSADFFLPLEYTLGYDYHFYKPMGFLPVINLMNANILDLYIQKKIGRNFTLRFDSKDIFSQSRRNVSRITNSNTLYDYSNSRVLGRYFMVSLVVKFNKFGK